MSEKKVIICRCEDVSQEEIRAKLEQGYTTFEDLKRLLRVGMGPCQANTCGHLIQREISQYLHVPVESVPIHKVRPLASGVKLSSIVEALKDES